MAKNGSECLPKNLCDIMPPRAILDVLHEAEAEGVKIPKIVDDWWLAQTEKDNTPTIASMFDQDMLLGQD